LASNWGGSELLFVSIANEAIKQNDNVQLVLMQKNTFNNSIRNLFEKVDSLVIIQEESSSQNMIKKAWKHIKSKINSKVLNSVNHFKPDVILINQPNSLDASFNSIFSRFLSTIDSPYYLISHFNPEHYTYSFEDIIKLRYINHKAQKVFFVSERNKRRFEHQIAQKLDNGCLVANHPLISTYDYIKYPKNNNTIQFASVARLECNFKGQDILFEILSSNKWKDRDWHLNLYGNGPDERYLKELAKFYQLESRITFHGHVTHHTAIWCKNHILLMPSLGEGKPLALEEALMCGRPAVVSDVAGNIELIEHEMNGYIASSYFSLAFEIALEQAWDNKDNWETLGRNAHAKFKVSVDSHPAHTIFEIIKKDLNV